MNQVTNLVNTDSSKVSDIISIFSNVRCLMHCFIYPNQEYIDILTERITRHISCLHIEYDPYEKCFTLKIKKTLLKKVNGFEHSTIFYYKTFNLIFAEFLSALNNKILEIMMNVYGSSSAIQLFLFLLRNESLLSNFYNLECYGDNIVKIHL